MLYSSTISISESDPGTLSAYVAEAASVRLRLREILVARAVVRSSTAFSFRSVSGADDFVVDVRGSDSTNTEAADTISNLHTSQN